MDHKLTEKIQAWLQTPADERDVMAGANLLLSLNRNRILYQNVARRPEKFAGKVEYELRKHLKIRLDDKTLADVAVMEKTVIPEARKTVAVHAGKREDHDTLPDSVKSLWEVAASHWFKVKELFETLKSMEDAQPCDRYEHLKLLDEADRKHRSCLESYDAYVPGAELPKEDNTKLPEPAELAKKIQAARKYISDNKKRLAELKDTDEGKYAALLAKVQERLDYLRETGNAVSDEQIQELKELGIATEA